MGKWFHVVEILDCGKVAFFEQWLGLRHRTKVFTLALQKSLKMSLLLPLQMKKMHLREVKWPTKRYTVTLGFYSEIRSVFFSSKWHGLYLWKFLAEKKMS